MKQFVRKECCMYIKHTSTVLKEKSKSCNVWKELCTFTILHNHQVIRKMSCKWENQICVAGSTVTNFASCWTH